MQFERPRFGEYFIADHGGPIHVVGIFRPQLFPVAGVENDQFAFLEFAGQELLPVVPVRVRSTQHNVAIGVHQRQTASAGADVRGIGDVDWFFPQFFTCPTVDRNRHPQVKLLHFRLGLASRFAGQLLRDHLCLAGTAAGVLRE